MISLGVSLGRASKKLELKPQRNHAVSCLLFPLACRHSVLDIVELAIMTRFLALTLAAILGAAASVAAFAPSPGAASARPSTSSETSLAYGTNYGVMDGDDEYYRGTDRYGRAGYGGSRGGYGRSGYNDD